MSKKLEDAELALAVARVVHDLPDDLFLFDWRPDLGGAAGAEALDWIDDRILAWERGRNVKTGEKHVRGVFKSGDRFAVSGPTLWIAICRAIVAYGDQS